MLSLKVSQLLWDSTAFMPRCDDTPLIDSLKVRGFLNDFPIVVMPVVIIDWHSHYLVVSGRRVSRVAAMLGIETIPAIVIDYDQAEIELRREKTHCT